MATRKGAAHAANIMDALKASPKPLSAYDLLDQLRPTGVAAPLTVYRALDKLMTAGQVHRIESLNAFVACKGEDYHVHAHETDRTVGFAICDQCGSVDEFVDKALSTRVFETLAARTFVPRTSALEVHGVCGPCRKQS